MSEEAKKDKTEQKSEQNVEQDVQQNTDQQPSEDADNEAQQSEEQSPKTELELAQEKINELNVQIESLTRERDDYKEQVLRRAADFDNYRKRMIQEKQDAFDYANTNLLQDLLDSLDNFDRTLEAGKTAKDVKSVVEGIKLINKGLVSILENKYNLVAYGVAGELFNPDEHEAIGSSQGPVAEPVLKEVYLKGYKLKNRVIRHAKVMVTMPDGTVKNEDLSGKDKEEPKKDSSEQKKGK